MSQYTVSKVDGKWAVVSKQTGLAVASCEKRNDARTKKVELDKGPAVADVKDVKVGLDAKVAVVTPANYHANMARAAALKEKMKGHVQKTGGFPSHGVIQREWGFNISLKALCRHKKALAKELHIKKPKTTSKIAKA